MSRARSGVVAPGAAYLTFVARGRTFALPLPEARGVEPLGSVTPLPNTPPWVLGLVNLHGPIVAAVDLGLFLGLSDDGTPPSRLIICRLEDVHVALAVQSVIGLRRVPTSAIQPAGPVAGDLARYLVGLLPVGEQIVAVLDPARLLLAPEFQITDAATPGRAEPERRTRGERRMPAAVRQPALASGAASQIGG